MNLLVARDLNLIIANQPILQNINLSLESGKVLGVLGPNGAGKTSLLKLLSGQTDSAGKVSWNNKKLTEYQTIDLAKQVAVVNQLNQSVFALNLQQIVRMGLLPHKTLLSRQTKEDDQEIAKAIERVGLSEKTNQTFSSLSGGEQQRGLIARALVQKAKLIVLDEPVNHLDIYYQHQILDLLRALAHQFNMTVVMSLHDLNLAANYCDELCLLHKGKVSAQGSVETVLKANLLEQVFGMPCDVSYQASSDNSASNIRIDFYPPNLTELKPTCKGASAEKRKEKGKGEEKNV
ncbi:ABC transporter ATP-binding protein [Paraglaciecola aquimarina]|uniref:ABC transporter ATP-binding protein n=1 Tax=Paraglaciecola algarum TaxID=3050085 RepID=A0ABS9DBY7_9ALTE|nr:ABC transporter ATP-binding protein [Paraglaciecola sp. G1-23]MCF2949862.1 ABC transporter ATP-binding protein [Paraglaciecola sp. G1-23]